MSFRSVCPCERGTHQHFNVGHVELVEGPLVRELRPDAHLRVARKHEAPRLVPFLRTHLPRLPHHRRLHACAVRLGGYGGIRRGHASARSDSVVCMGGVTCGRRSGELCGIVPSWCRQMVQCTACNRSERSGSCHAAPAHALRKQGASTIWQAHPCAQRPFWVEHPAPLWRLLLRHCERHSGVLPYVCHEYAHIRHIEQHAARGLVLGAV